MRKCKIEFNIIYCESYACQSPLQSIKMNQIHIGSMKQISTLFKTIFIPVDGEGEIICDYEKYGGTRQELLNYLGIPKSNFKGLKFQASIEATIRILPLYPGKLLPDDMEVMESALLVFDEQNNIICPKVLQLFAFQSFVGDTMKLKEKLNCYIVEEKPIGHGSFGVVNRVQQKSSGQWFAMKTINIMQFIEQLHGSIGHEQARNKIINEISIQQKVKSEYVIKIIEQIESDDNIYIVMELGQQSLQSYLVQKVQPLQFAEILNIFTNLCKALKAIHDCGIIHRDVNPKNFVLCQNNLIKLIDFGLARESQDATTQLGTPLYMAPEIAKGEKYSKSADIFSLGCILYFMLTRKTAFKSKGGVMQTLEGIISDEPDRIMNITYPESIITLCYEMLIKDPQKRPQIDKILKDVVDIENSFGKTNLGSDIQQQKSKQEEQQVNQTSNSQQNQTHWDRNLQDQSLLKFSKLKTQFEIVYKEFKTQLQQIESEIALSNKSKQNKIEISIFKEICDAAILNMINQNTDKNAILCEINNIKNTYSTFQQDALTFARKKCSATVIGSQVFQKRILTDGEIQLGAFNNFGMTGFCSVTLKDGKFQGEFQSSQRWGFGQHKYNENEYSGEYKKGKRDGKGIYTCKEYAYDGDWIQDQRHGIGKVKFSNGDQYSGQWENDKRSGIGKMQFQNGNIYEGQFLNDNYHGVGKFTSNDFVYEGEWLNGQYSGKGSYQDIDGNILEGNWVKNFYTQSAAQYYCANGDYYNGQWTIDENTKCVNGKGTIKYAIGDVYVGQFHNGLKHGTGKMEYSNGNWYEGEYQNDKQHGYGKSKTDGGIGIYTYEGGFKNGNIAGQGRIERSDGSVYQGGLCDYSQASGKGVLKTKEGDIYDGQWIYDGPCSRDGLCHKLWTCGDGIIQYSNGDVYQGHWSQYGYIYWSCGCVKQGKGKLTRKNGQILEGIWNDNNLKE